MNVMNRLGTDRKGVPLKKQYSSLNSDDYVVVLTRRASKEDEGDLIRGVALKVDHIRLRELFRYGDVWDFVLTILGILFSIISAVLLAILILSYGTFFRFATEYHCKCKSLEDDEGHTLGIIFICVSLSFAVSSLMCHFCSAMTGTRQLEKIRKAYFRAAMKKDFSWLDCYVDRGLSSRMITEITELRDGLGLNLSKIVYSVTCCILLTSIPFALYTNIAFVCLFTIPFYAATKMLPFFAEDKLTQTDQKAYENNADSLAVSILSNVRIVKLFHKEEDELRRFKASLPSPWKMWTPVLFSAISAALRWLLPYTMQVLVILLVLTYFEHDTIAHSDPAEAESDNMNTLHNCTNFVCSKGSIFSLQFEPMIGHICVVFNCILYVYHHITQILHLIKRTRKVLRIAGEVFFVIDWKSGIDNFSTEGYQKEGVGEGKIVMSNVYFAYPRRPEIFVLQGLHISIKPGQMVTIFGPTDSGKSTILKILLRLYDVRDGKVKFDGVEVKRHSVRWYRSHFGLFQHELTLFNTTIMENLRYCKLNASFQEIIAACKKAEAHDSIMKLPLGYKTVVGVKSKKTIDDALSKKIILAQIILTNRRILLLDGYISDLDKQLEELVLSTLLQMKKQNCTIILTVDKVNSIVKACDNVFALKNGRVVETGSHAVLIKKKKRYFRMVEETWENVSTVTPYFRSQLTNFKFAEAITRLHRQHDEAGSIDWSEFVSDKTLLSSVYFRHVAEKIPRIVQSRPIGCFTSYTTFPLEPDICKTTLYEEKKQNCTYPNGYYMVDYYKKLVRNNLIRERDFREKMASLRSPYILESNADYADTDYAETTSAGSAMSVTFISETPGPDDSGDPEPVLVPVQDYKPHSILKIKSQSQNELHEENSYSDTSEEPVISRLALAGDSRVGISLIEEGEDADNLESLAKPRPKKIRFREMSLSSTHISNQDLDSVLNSIKYKDYVSTSSSTSSEAFSDELRSLKINDDRLKHYFGWMVNSAISSDSINSDESHTFWEEYNLQLQIAVEKKVKLFKSQVLPLTIYSWPFIISTCFTSTLAIIGIFNYVHRLSLIQAEYIGLHFDEAKHTCYDLFIFLFLTSVTPFVQELVMGFGSYWATQKLRVFLFKSFLYQKLEWFDTAEHDVTFLCDGLASDTASFQAVIFTGTTTLTYFVVFITSLLEHLANAGEDSYSGSVNVFVVLFIPWMVLARYATARFLRRYVFWVSEWLQKPGEMIFDCLTNARTIIILGIEERFIPFVIAFRAVAYGISEAAVYLSIGLWLVLCRPLYANITIMSYIYTMNLMFLSIHPTGFGLAFLTDSIDINSWVSRLAEGAKNLQEHKAGQKLKKYVNIVSNNEPPVLRCENIYFAYSAAPELLILKGITIDFPSGIYTAIVGPTDSGKTTLLNILLNLCVPTDGCVLINDINYKDIHKTCLKNVIGGVDQDPCFMQELTVAENIAYGCEYFNMVQIRAAAKLASIETIIETFADKYETKLQDLPETAETFVFRQRLAFARAAVVNPKILVVDDATLSVDTHNSRLLHRALQKLRDGRTLIVASRRIEPIRSADVIIVLQNGRIVEKGTDTELRALKGFYYELFISQVFYETNEAHAHD